ncbi:MAG: flagellar hook-associated protein FlgL [Bacteroidota bacterium]
MRITNNVIFNTLLENINKNRQGLFEEQQKSSSGKRVDQPSDDPFAFANSKSVKAINERLSSYQANIEDGREQLNVAQGTINQMLDKLQDVKQIAIRGANESTLSNEEMNILADQVQSAKETLVNLANITHNGRYLFGGTATQNKPFQLSGGSVTYNGNSNALQIAVNDQTRFDSSITGDRFMGMFNALDSLETSFRNNDTDAVRGDLDALEDGITEVGSAGADLGTISNRLDFLFEQYESSKITNDKQISRLVDADMAEVLSNIQKYEVSYRAALNASSRILQNSLVNLL